MTTEELIEKLQRFCVSLEKDELYLLRGMVMDVKGKDTLCEMIDKKIVYLENLPRISERN